jgi:antimicrobial peptide system SdpB family protein
MQATMNLLSSLDRDIWSFNPQSRVIALARSGLALSQVLTLVFTPAAYLYEVPILGQPSTGQCTRFLENVSLFCVVGGLPDDIVQILMILGLIVVISGWLPRFTSILHFWLSYSFAHAVALPDGGDTVLVFTTFFLVFVCLPDARIWHWSQSNSWSSARFGALQGISWAAHWALRFQVAYIYLHSALAKLSVENWSEGSALYYIVRGEFFGTANFFQGFVFLLTSIPIVALSLSWGTMIVECLIAVSLLSKQPVAQTAGFVACAMLHVGIIAFIGIWSFALAMIFSVMIAGSRGLGPVMYRLWIRSPFGASRRDDLVPVA